MLRTAPTPADRHNGLRHRLQQVPRGSPPGGPSSFPLAERGIYGVHQKSVARATASSLDIARTSSSESPTEWMSRCTRFAGMDSVLGSEADRTGRLP